MREEKVALPLTPRDAAFLSDCGIVAPEKMDEHFTCKFCGARMVEDVEFLILRDGSIVCCEHAEPGAAISDPKKKNELPLDHTLRWMLANQVPLTLGAYVAINWCGGKTVEEVLADGELAADLPQELVAMEEIKEQREFEREMILILLGMPVSWTIH